MARRLIVLADGTWNTPQDEDEGQLAPTNVVKMYEAVRRCPTASDGTQQLSFYHPGVGARPDFLERAYDKVAELLHLHTVNRNLLDGITGDGIDKNISDCYRWLVQHYLPGDQIFLSGFSRGAYTARSLAGLIRNSGLLKHDDAALLADAFRLYRDRSADTHPRSALASKFRQQYSYEPRIRFIGVWDTVGALGIPLGMFKELNAELFQFHDVSLSSYVDMAYQALAIDEQRKPFAPAVWEQQPAAAAAGQILQQVWFAGVHSNVGGGYADCGLSDQAFLWLAQAAASAGLQLDTSYVQQYIDHANPLGVLRNSMSAAYELAGPYSRPIAAGRTAAMLATPGFFDKTRERVHPSARTRFGKIAPLPTTTYGPSNLQDYLERNSSEPPFTS